MSESPKAVFLSYAREDTDAARRIAEALRGFGVEVWFDQSELHGGDAWDAKIRRQIRECALFVPLVSQQTEARAEGYFRREWKIAIDRTQDMGSSRTFIVPVVIDNTKESGADVPEEFMRYQWTRLPQGAPTPEFVALVKRLLEAPRKPVAQQAEDRNPRPEGGPMPKKTAPMAALWISLGVVAVSVGGVFFVTSRRGSTEEAASPAAPAASLAVPNAKLQTPEPARWPAADAKSIAVLPFVNMSGDKDSEYFSDGLTEEILNALARNPALRVAARTSSFAFKGKTVPMEEIGRALRAASVIEGSVRKDGSRVRITVQLINAADGYHVWSETFTREMTDIFAVQDEIATKVAQKLGGPATGSAAPATSAVPTKNLAAYDLYLRARAAQNNGASEQTLETLRLYEQALRADPDYALPWARLADVCADIFGRGLDSSNEMAVKARSAASAALRLGPDLPETRLALARIAQYIDRDLAAARRELDLVERLRPGEAELPAARVRLAYAGGQWDDSLVALLNKAVEADPQNATMLNAMAGILTSIGRWAEADALYDRAWAAGVGIEVAIRGKVGNLLNWTNDVAAALALLNQTPEAARPTSRFYNQRAALRMQLGDYDGAIADYERYREGMRQNYPTRSGPRSVGVGSMLGIAEVEALRGNEARAKQALDQALAEAEVFRREFPELEGRFISLAYILARRGQVSEALSIVDDTLRRAIESRDASDISIRRRAKAGILALVGRKDEAIAELQTVHASGYAFGYGLRRNLDYRSLHGDPRFQKLMAEAETRADAQPRPKK